MDKCKKERMLPTDFQTSKKKNKLGNSKKDIVPSGGFFLFPEDLKGKQKIKDRKFLVFYFDNDGDYNIVRYILERKSNSKRGRSHPDMNSSELVRIVKEHGK